MFAVELWGDLFQKVDLRANGILRTEYGVLGVPKAAPQAAWLSLSSGAHGIFRIPCGKRRDPNLFGGKIFIS